MMHVIWITVGGFIPWVIHPKQSIWRIMSDSEQTPGGLLNIFNHIKDITYKFLYRHLLPASDPQ